MRFPCLPGSRPCQGAAMCCIVAISWVVARPASATVLHVPADFPTIQAAINAAAASGDVVVVNPGTYFESIDFLGKSVLVKSTSLIPSGTIIDAGGNGRVVRMVGVGPNAGLRGFTLRNGVEGTGGGVRIEGSGTIDYCTIEHCTAATFGGGIWATGDAIIDQCTIRDNTASNGAGVRVAGDATISSCDFDDNTATNEGGAIDVDGSVQVTDCFFRSNIATEGSALRLRGGTSTGNRLNIKLGAASVIKVESNATLANSEIVGGDVGVDIVQSGSTATVQIINCSIAESETALAVDPTLAITTLVRNSILWPNTTAIDGLNLPNLSVQYSDVRGGWPGIGNIDKDPMFLFFETGGLVLQRESPCIDAGKNFFAEPYGSLDLAQKGRFVADASTADTGFPSAAIVDMGAREVQGEVRYVKADATGANTGLSWADAYTDLQDALDEVNGTPSISFAYILIGEGNYKPDRGTGDRAMSFTIDRNMWLVGGFAGVDEREIAEADALAHPTTLGGAIGAAGVEDNSFHVVRVDGGLANADIMLRNVILQRGNASGAAASLNDRGGAVLSTGSTVHLVDCVLRQNEADHAGGAVWLDDLSFVHMERCRFYGNISRGTGSAIHMDGGIATLRSSLVHGNDSVERGAIYLDEGAWAFLTCSTVADNVSSAGNTGGILVQPNGLLALHSSIVWKNLGTAGTLENQNVRVLGDVARESWVEGSTIQGWSGAFGGTENNGSNPDFVAALGRDRVRGTSDDDYHLAAGSPAIDSAFLVTDQMTGLPFLDLDRVERPQDDPNVPNGAELIYVGLDRGCYETQRPPCVGDLNGDGAVDAADLAVLLGAWGTGAGPADLDASGSVNGADLAVLLGAWGPC